MCFRFPRVGKNPNEIKRLKELSDHFFNGRVFKDGEDPFIRPWVGINFPSGKMGCLDCAKLYNIDPTEYGTKGIKNKFIIGNYFSKYLKYDKSKIILRSLYVF